MNQFFNNKRMITLLVSVIIFIGTIAFSLARSREDVSLPQMFMNDVTGIASTILSKPGQAVSSFVDSADNLLHTYEENQELKKQIAAVDELQARITTLEEEKQALQAELELRSTLSDHEQITASVISRTPDNWLDIIQIDKGSEDGIEVDMSVMSGNGMVGRVAEVSPTQAKVMLLTTQNQTVNRVSAEIQAEGGAVHGIVNGYDREKGTFIMSEVKPDAKLEPGMTVVTSGMGGISPSSLLIGTVEEIRMDQFGLFQEVTIKPASNLENIRFVTVIKRNSEEGQ